jgi:hypothetical protein
MTSSIESAGVNFLSYAPTGAAAPVDRPGVRVFGAAVILATGLGLIGLGGCFLIGVLSMVAINLFVPNARPLTWTMATYVLHAVLYLLAFSCFFGAVVFLVMGTRRVLRIIGG